MCIYMSSTDGIREGFSIAYARIANHRPPMHEHLCTSTAPLPISTRSLRSPEQLLKLCADHDNLLPQIMSQDPDLGEKLLTKDVVHVRTLMMQRGMSTDRVVPRVFCCACLSNILCKYTNPVPPQHLQRCDSIRASSNAI